MAEDIKIILRPLITEKGVEAATHQNTYQFEVALAANKAQIKQAVEHAFSVKVQTIRTSIRQGKPRRVRYKRGTTRIWKKAVVTLVPGNTIEFI